MRSMFGWLGRRALDLLVGAGGILLAAVVAVALSALLDVLVEGPAWGRWAIVAPVTVAVLTLIGHWWRGGHRPSPRAQIPELVEVAPPVSKLPPHLAALTDDELRAKGFADPAALRCMGLARYGQAAARAAERERSCDTNADLTRKLEDTAQQVHDLLKDMPRGGVARAVPLDTAGDVLAQMLEGLAPPGPTAGCYRCSVPVAWIPADADNVGRWEHLYEPDGRVWEHQAARSPWEQCAACGGGIHLLDAPSGAWWAHDAHPVDGHDAVLRGPVPEGHVPLIVTVPAADVDEAMKRMKPEDMPPGGVLFLPEEVTFPDEPGARPSGCACHLLSSCARCDEDDAADDNSYPDVYPEPADRKDD